MGLINNTTLNSSLNCTQIGGENAGLTSMWFREGDITFFLNPNIDPKYGTPTSTPRLMPIKSGGMSAINALNGAGNLSAQMQLGRDMDAALLGAGELSSSMTLIVSMLSDLAGSGTMSLSLNAVISLACDLAGSGNVTAALGLLVSFAASMEGSGNITSNLTGLASLSADITSQGDVLTTANVGEAVWSALAALNNQVGTMGEKLNDAGAAGNPWAALLSANNDPATFGKLIQDMQTLVDELHKIQGLDAASPMTVTQTDRTAGDITLAITGDGTTITTVTRE